jgi:hypothetical protein
MALVSTYISLNTNDELESRSSNLPPPIGPGALNTCSCYNLPTPEEIAALGLDNNSEQGNEGDDESTELEDTDEDEGMDK